MKYYAVLGTLPYSLKASSVIYTGNALFYVPKGSVIECVLNLTRSRLLTKMQLTQITEEIIKAKGLCVDPKALVSYLIKSGIYEVFSAPCRRLAWLKFSNKARFTLPFIKGFFEEGSAKNPEMYRSWNTPEQFFSKLEQSMLNYLIFQQRECLKDIFGNDLEDKIRASYPEFLTRYDLTASLSIFMIPKYKDVPTCAIKAGICNLFMQRCLVIMSGFSKSPTKTTLSESNI